MAAQQQEPKKQEPKKTAPAAAAAENTGKAASQETVAAKPVKKRKSFTGGTAKVFITSSFNNTIITIADERGNTLLWSSSGSSGFKGTKKGTPFGAQIAAENLARKAVDLGVSRVVVLVRGPGSGREAAVRSLQASGLTILSIRDITPLPHNGCRARKPRRV
ncbi:MAG: 30S ribosomal protein S11 [Elusimicrobiota bacterium]